jgi:membrane carboxypeptidase/penicillin-binding protein PbpC
LGIGNAAVLVTDPATGDILAMVGSKDFFDIDSDGNVNLTTSLRQPGSAIKLIAYTAALENGFSEGTVLQDSPITIEIPGAESYRPVNYDGRFHGMVPLRLAFANSYNIPAVRIAEKLGPKLIAEYGQKMGISSWEKNNYYGLSIALGGNEVTMIDLATAYGVIANEGQRVDLSPILEVRDGSGRVVYEKSPEASQVIDRGVSFIIKDILSDNQARSSAFGSNSLLNIPGKRVSVKTGTSDNKRDNWTVGFTKDYVVATWVGNNDNTPLSPTLASGITGAAPLWRNIMEELVKDKSDNLVLVPSNLVSKNCFGYEAYFIIGTENSSPCKIMRPSPTPAIQ